VQREVMHNQPGQMRGQCNKRQHDNQTACQKAVTHQRLRCDEMPHDNQPGKWDATARREVLTYQEGERRCDYRQHDNQPGQTRGVGG
jgi:hypothetical protein